MELLLRQPITIIGLVMAIGITFYFGTKLIQEIRLNTKLKEKQQALRVYIPTLRSAKRYGVLGSVALAPVVAVVLFIMIGVSPNTPQETNIIRFTNSSDIISLYERYAEKLDSDYRSNNNWFTSGSNTDMETTNGLPTEQVGDDFGSDDYSETNNQVLGVDEMDNVVTDGKYIYTLDTNSVQISLAYTTEAGPSVLDLHKTFDYTSDVCSSDQFYPTGMYVDDSRLIVVGNIYEYQCDEDNQNIYAGYYNYYYNNSSHVGVKVYDKTDDFVLEDTYTMKGYFTGTRKIDDALYIVTNQGIPYYQFDGDLEPSIDEYNESTMDNYLPEYSINETVITATYDNIIYLEGTNPNTFTTFYGIDLNTSEVDMEVVLSDQGHNLYVSEDNMYLVGTVYYFWENNLNIIETETDVRNYQTAIMKINIDNGSVAYQTSGFIAGHTLDQFSMDEYKGNLRITTTTGWWGEEINNRLFILDDDLHIISVLQHLGKPRETIRSTRFVGDYAYLVTFEQTDPFYVINVSEPDNPVVEGELEIPGFSTYLQPLGANRMLGIGFGDSQGGTSGIKISIYDISDKSNPNVFSEITYDYSKFGYVYSSVTYEHKDLLVSLDKGLIALPFSSNYYDSVTGYQYNSGVLVFHYSEAEGLSEAGYIQHDNYSEEDVYVYKSKFISDYLYTISNQYIKVSTIAQPENILYETAFDIE